MRKLLRAKARAAMEREGVRHINRWPVVMMGGVPSAGDSFFARRWREYAAQ